ncbi:hypothetical protein KQX54_005917 [Cotesia glomerata]|uniref:TIL domain-containing protein n=1 Tax=Cotesia glomerata TaxID=32391 RepID=A0AAV7IX25_COTGL|nr:hypothetical protein KQX54_005917 [Cotesia glomerata]
MVCKISILFIAAVICFTWVEASFLYKYDRNGCSPKEHLVYSNPDCEPTCSNHDGPIFCTKYFNFFKIGGRSCFCVKGYLRNSNGDCVKAEECPKLDRVGKNPSYKCHKNECGPNEHLVNDNPSCEPTCSNHDSPFICTRMGGPSCYCVEGYLRNSNGVCVKVEECPQRRDGNIIFPKD